MKKTSASQEVPIYQLKITLKDIRPPIWRRVLVRSDMTLYRLHQIIQIAMGWTESHLHQFEILGKYYGEPSEDFEVINEQRVRLNQVFRGPKVRGKYEYDFGDGWEHDILVEKVMPPEPGRKYPACIAGKRQCPPEDVGGVWGYSNFLDAIANEDHAQHKDYLAWVGGSFDPEEFHLEAVDADLNSIR